MKRKNKIVIFPPCGENVAIATKRGANKVLPILPLLPRLTAVLPPQGREMRRGFTLIELLVVVLIIGILAAVAVPQYQKAVEKARLAQVLPLATALYKAEKTYFLANGEHTADLSLLDMEVPSCELKNNYYDCNSFWVGVWGPTHAQIVLLDSSNSFQLAYLHFFADNEEDNAREGDIFCYSNGEIYRKVCQSLGTGTETTSNHKAWNYAYVLSK